MPSLLETQRAMRAALLDGDDAAALALIAGDDGAQDRFDVHRTNVLSSLTAALEETFPVVCRLVDARFFAFAAHEFICDHPPETSCVADYGARFPEFLGAFPPCAKLHYLEDVARLEWGIDRATRAEAPAPLQPAHLAHLREDDAARLVFTLQPSYRYLASPWPIERIWRAHRSDESLDAADLGAGGVRLEIRRAFDAIEVRVLPDGVFAFRETLAAGGTLAAAAEAARSHDCGFDVAAALAALFSDRALAGFSLADNEVSQ